MTKMVLMLGLRKIKRNNEIYIYKIECVCVCVSFMRYYTIHPIATKLWEVVEYTPVDVI